MLLRGRLQLLELLSLLMSLWGSQGFVMAVQTFESFQVMATVRGCRSFGLKHQELWVSANLSRYAGENRLRLCGCANLHAWPHGYVEKLSGRGLRVFACSAYLGLRCWGVLFGSGLATSEMFCAWSPFWVLGCSKGGIEISVYVNKHFFTT